MATSDQLQASGQLGRAMPRLLTGQQAERRFFFTKRFKEWFDTEMLLIRPTFWGRSVPIREQINGIIRSFVAGDDLHLPGQLHAVRPYEYGVWELKTGDVRIFGWFPRMDDFVASTAGEGTDLHEWMDWSYYCKCMWTVSDRNALNLNHPKFLPGVNKNDVLRP